MGGFWSTPKPLFRKGTLLGPEPTTLLGQLPSIPADSEVQYFLRIAATSGIRNSRPRHRSKLGEQSDSEGGSFQTLVMQALQQLMLHRGNEKISRQPLCCVVTGGVGFSGWRPLWTLFLLACFWRDLYQRSSYFQRMYLTTSIAFSDPKTPIQHHPVPPTPRQAMPNRPPLKLHTRSGGERTLLPRPRH